MRLSILLRRFAAVMLSVVFFISTIYMFGYYDTVQAAGTVGISASGYTPVFGGSSAVVVDSGITINTSDFSSVNVIIENPQSGDLLGYTGSLPVGVTGSPSNTSNILTFTKTPSAAITAVMWQELLCTVTFDTTSTSLVSRAITFSLGSAIPFSGNRHYYQYITPRVSWIEARARAASKTFLGMTGYLATITNADENAFIKNLLIPVPYSAWIGASDDSAQGTSEGRWKWVTGPEAGTLFSIGSSNTTTEMYMNWDKSHNEPNNSGTENYAQILTNGQWNDISNTSTYGDINGYVVEYGGMTGESDVQSSVSKTVSIIFDRFDINYSLDGGTNYSGAPLSYTKASDTIVLGIPQKTGYGFAGWYDSVPGGSLILQIPQGSSGEKDLFAGWNANTNTQYKVEHYQQNIPGTGYALKETDDLTGTTDFLVSAAGKTYTGFTLNTLHAGTINAGTILADGSLVMKLYYDRVPVLVTFADQDGTELKKDTVLYDGTATPPSDPTRIGYLFTGWLGTYANVTADQTVTATYEPKLDTKYKVEYYQQAVSGTDYVNKETDYLAGTTATAVSASVKSYTGFTPDAAHAGTVTGGTILADGSLVLKLYYNRVPVLVTFVDQGGAELKKDTVLYEGKATPPMDPTRTGYMFAGWSGTYAEVTADQAVTATYTPMTDTAYKVEHYQQNVAGTDYTISDTEYLTGITDTSVSAAAMSYAGFTPDAAHAGTVTGGTILADGSLVLKLYYNRVPVLVTFVDQGGAELKKDTVLYEGKATPPMDPTRTGYTFAGWYKESGDVKAWNFDIDTVNTDMTLFAKWTINSYSVIFLDWDGTAISSQTIAYGKDAIAPANPVRSGYTFTSWSMPFANVTGTVTAIAVYSQNPDPTPTPTPIPVPAPDADVLGADRVTAVPAAPATVTTTGVLGAAKTGEAENQNTILAAFILLAAFGTAGTVYVLRRKNIEN